MNAIRPCAAACALAIAVAAIPASGTAAGFTETLPKGAFLVDTNYTQSWLNGRWDDSGNYAPLIDSIERYEPGGGLQGILIPNVDVQYQMVVTQVQYGILDELSVGIGIPVVLRTTVDPRFSWIAGDYQQQLGRAYSQADFWAWANSMGQPTPTAWVGNQGTLSDIILGARWRWTDRIPSIKGGSFASAIMFSGAIPTSSQADPENLLAAGTTMWDLHTQGDLNFDIAIDYTFKKELDDRLTLGLDIFYDIFLPHTYRTPTGAVNPLILNYEPYVGSTYSVDGGDFIGFSVQADVTPVKGPALATWLSDHSKTKAEGMPPLWTISLRYTFDYLEQSIWASNSDIWDWDREKIWAPGYKNILSAKMQFSFLRLGVPLQVYAVYRTLGLIPGKNTRAAEVVSAGIQVPLKFW